MHTRFILENYALRKSFIGFIPLKPFGLEKECIRLEYFVISFFLNGEKIHEFDQKDFVYCIVPL